MEDLQFYEGDVTFGCRAAAIVISEDENKVLLSQIKGRDEWITPGGRIHFYESSHEAIKRELREEIGLEIDDIDYLGTVEEFGFNKYKNVTGHQIELFHKVICKCKITNETFDGLEGDYQMFKWVDLADVDNYNLRPFVIKEMLKDLSVTYHFCVDNDKKSKV